MKFCLYKVKFLKRESLIDNVLGTPVIVLSVDVFVTMLHWCYCYAIKVLNSSNVNMILSNMSKKGYSKVMDADWLRE